MPPVTTRIFPSAENPLGPRSRALGKTLFFRTMPALALGRVPGGIPPRPSQFFECVRRGDRVAPGPLGNQSPPDQCVGLCSLEGRVTRPFSPRPSRGDPPPLWGPWGQPCRRVFHFLAGRKTRLPEKTETQRRDLLMSVHPPSPRPSQLKLCVCPCGGPIRFVRPGARSVPPVNRAFARFFARVFL